MDFPSLQPPAGEPPKDGPGLQPPLVAPAPPPAPIAKKVPLWKIPVYVAGACVYAAAVFFGARRAAAYLLLRQPDFVEHNGLRPYLVMLAPHALGPTVLLPASGFVDARALLFQQRAAALQQRCDGYRGVLAQDRRLRPADAQAAATLLDHISQEIRIGQFDSAEEQLNRVEVLLPKAPQPIALAAAPKPIDVPAPPQQKAVVAAEAPAPAPASKSAKKSARKKKKTVKKKKHASGQSS